MTDTHHFPQATTGRWVWCAQ